MYRMTHLAVPAIAFVFAFAGCHSTQTATQPKTSGRDSQPAQDPAAANLAPAGVIETTSPGDPAGYDSEGNATSSNPGVNYTAQAVAPEAPPDLPQYDQPAAPGENYIWTPGYWAWSNRGYYWVPGAWVLAPYAGALWTPGYWDYSKGQYRWHDGYWARHVGYYGGVNYGHGYDGSGYEGGYWRGDSFCYNHTVSRVDTRTVQSVYSYRVENHYNTSSVSYDGGPGGLKFEPNRQEIAAQHEQHIGALPVQEQIRQTAQNNRAQFARENHGHPKLLAENQPRNGPTNSR